MGTRASIIFKEKHNEKNNQIINLWCRGDGYIKSQNGFGLGLDIMQAVNDLLSLNNKKLLKKTDLNLNHLSLTLLHNAHKKAVDYHNQYKEKYQKKFLYSNDFFGTPLYICDFDEQAPHSLIYTLYPDKIHIEGYDYTKDSCEWCDCLFEGNYKEFAKFLKNYEMKW